MKIGERVLDDDGKIIVQQTHDFTPYVRQVRQARDLTNGGRVGESRHVGRIPTKLLTIWLKEAGVSWTDTNAVQDVIRRKLMSGEFSALRNWEGNF